MQLIEARSTEDFIKSYEVLQELRPHHNLETYLATIEQMRKEGYRLWYVEEDGKAVCAAGFRLTTTLYDGRIIDFDDFVTSGSARRKGYAGILFGKLAEIAKHEGIRTIHLNSAHHRYDAHRFYLNKGMKIIAHHFRIEL